MTPMQILKNNLNTLSQKLESFQEINLNKAKAKEVWVQNMDDEYILSFPDEPGNMSYYSKKEVKSDFIKIFKAKTKKQKYSIAFHFEYLVVADPFVQCSIKEGDAFSITEKMSLADFKEKLNQLNDRIVSNDVVNCVDLTKNVFLGQALIHDHSNQKKSKSFKS